MRTRDTDLATTKRKLEHTKHTERKLLADKAAAAAALNEDLFDFALLLGLEALLALENLDRVDHHRAVLTVPATETERSGAGRQQG